MAKTAGKAKKQGGKKETVTARPLLAATRLLQKDAKGVQKRLPSTAVADRERLGKFIEALNDVQISIREACEEMGSGNPMFETFTVEK